jgi:hypothetical protein
MNKITLEILDYWENVIPIAFLFFTHFVDERVHKHWKNEAYHTNKLIKMIYRYQWELLFLVISLLAILGIKMVHGEGDVSILGVYILFGCLSGMIILFLFIIYILSKETRKLNANAFYASIFIYAIYVSIDFYFFKLDVSSLGSLRPVIIIIPIVISFISYLFLRNYINWALYSPELREKDVKNSIRIYKDQRSTQVKKAEALLYILKHYQRRSNMRSLDKWCRIGNRDFPQKMIEIRDVLKF